MHGAHSANTLPQVRSTHRSPPAAPLWPSAPHLPRVRADANSIAQQALGNIRTVYAFNGEQRTLEAYSAALEQPVKVGWGGEGSSWIGGAVNGRVNGVGWGGGRTPEARSAALGQPAEVKECVAEGQVRWRAGMQQGFLGPSALLPPAPPFLCRLASSRASWAA